MLCLLQKQCYTLWDAFQIHSKNPNKLLPFPTPIVFKNIFIWRNLSVNWRKKLNLQKEKSFCNLPTLGENSQITSTQCVRLKLHIPWSQNDAFKELINQLKKTYTWKWEFQEFQLPQATCTKGWITKLHTLGNF